MGRSMMRRQLGSDERSWPAEERDQIRSDQGAQPPLGSRVQGDLLYAFAACMPGLIYVHDPPAWAACPCACNINQCFSWVPTMLGEWRKRVARCDGPGYSPAAVSGAFTAVHVSTTEAFCRHRLTAQTAGVSGRAGRGMHSHHSHMVTSS